MVDIKKKVMLIFMELFYIYIYNNFLIIWGIYTNICCEERVDALVCVMYQPITLHLTNITETL
jgi:hypothetical protein